MLTSVIGPYADRGLCIAAVWIPMLPDDNATAAAASSKMFDARVTQFYDGARKLGDALAASLGAVTTAWDIYLAYASDQRWAGSSPPLPHAYAHQLGDWADASRYHTGDALRAELGIMIEQVMSA